LKLLDKSVSNLSQRLNKLYPDNTSSNSSNDGINYWKGRKIIPLDKWLKITKANTISRRENYNVKEGLQYFPDDYFESMFPLGIPEDSKEEYRRNPRIGSTKCYECLLCPQRDESALLIGIHKVIAKGLEQKEDEGEVQDDTTSIYPCSVINRFECPYDKEQKLEVNNLNVNILFSLEIIAHAVDRAFLRAYSITQSNETIYETNFVGGKVKEINTLYDGRLHSWSSEYLLEEKLPQVARLSLVPIRNVDDVYHALINSEILIKVLEQGLEDEYRCERDFFVNLFMSIKDKIKKEDLTIYEPILRSNIQKGKCSISQEFANIHCTNCSNNNVWLCVDHWKQHKVDNHT
jgi:hypothetical protein